MPTNYLHLPELVSLWKSLLEYPEVAFVDKFIVNISTRLDSEPRGHQESDNKELIEFARTEISRYLEEGNVRVLERSAIPSEIFDCFGTHRTVEHYRSFVYGYALNAPYSAHFQSHLNKMIAQIEFQPYKLQKQQEFWKKEKVGAVKEILAKIFEVKSSDFDLLIDPESRIN